MQGKPMNDRAAKRAGRLANRVSLPFRTISWLMIALQLVTPAPVPGAAIESMATAQPSRMETEIQPLPETAMTPAPPLWANAEEEQIGSCGLFAEPLLPVGKASEADNRAMLAALQEFSKRKQGDDFSALQRFLDANPHSAWRASLLANLGGFLKENGYFTRAISAWQQAWELTKAAQTGSGKVIGDRAAAEFVRLNSNFGRVAAMSKLLDELKGRDTDPAVNDLLVNARESLLYMQQNPGSSYLCGPLALSRILNSQGKSAFPKEIEDARSTTNGLRLTDVLGLADRLGMNYQMARRTPGAKILLPAVVHLKVNHFAAIIRESEGRYLTQDPTSGGRDLWITSAALDDEGTGYYLVPTGPLPAGWQSVSQQEGQTVWGRGTISGFDGERFKKSDLMCGPCWVKSLLQLLGIGMPQYAVHAMLVSLTVEDTPIGYVPVFGPAVNFTVTYNQRDGTQPSTFTYPNIGKLWTFNWFSYILDNPSGPSSQTVTRYLPGGGEEDYTYSSTSGSYVYYATQADSRTVLIKTGSGSTATYELDFPDGSKYYYNQPDGSSGTPRKVFMTQMKDAQNNPLTITWAGSGTSWRISKVTDALTKDTTITYLSNTSSSPDYYKITTVADPFGRMTILTYGALSGTGDRPLLSITDMGQLTNFFAYDSTGFMTSMTTPYGTTRFSTGSNPSDPLNRWVEVTDPLGQKERTEFRQFSDLTGVVVPYSDDPAVVPALPVPTYNQNLNKRDTFFWNKKVMEQMGGVIDNTSYPKAHIYHWLHSGVNENVASGVLESEKDPLENRVWYQYPGMATSHPITTPPGSTTTQYEQPSDVARVLDPVGTQTAGATQLDHYEYNDLGKVTKHIDPLGRVTWFNYNANLVDLQEIRQGGDTSSAGDLVASFTYDTTYPRLVHTATDASGETTTYNYGSYGQLSSVVNAKSETTTLVYGDSAHPGFLTEIDGPVTGAKVTFTADSVPYRVGSVTDSESMTVNYAYDNFDRVTTVTYPDSTTEKTLYRFLDPVLAKDRLNRWSGAEYDPLRRVVATTDSLGRVTKFVYCGCGALESITDPKGHTTTFLRDLQNRVTGKLFADGTQVTTTYENTTSRVKEVTDAKGQKTDYAYNLDNTLQQLSYSGAAIFTPGVSFTYDTTYNRVLTMSDGTGTTSYAYNPITTTPTLGAGRLASVTVPFNGSTTTYSYDELGRVKTQAIDSVSATATYDSLGRVTVVANALGSFTYNYVSTTGRLSSVLYPLNHQEVDFTYFPSTDAQNRERLKTIQNTITSSHNNLSKFDYTYDAQGRISTWTRQADSGTPTTYTYQYDLADQLLTAALAGVETYTYNYDSAGNRVSEAKTTANTATTAGYNNVNELFKRTDGQRIHFAGSVSPNSTITINGVPANTATPPSGNYDGYASVSSDSNVVTLVATDATGARTNITKTLSVSPTGTPKVLTYDLNGNLISAVTGSAEETYEWDAADRMVAINHRTGTAPGTRSEFTYDGLGRRVRIVERDATGAVTSDKRYVWSGMSLREERDSANSALNKKYFGQGVEIGTAKYFYTRDHLGSIREMVDSSGNIKARYEYDPYGRRTKVSGTMDADFGFTGYFFHAPSGLCLAPYRTYDADTGRWLSRDPIGEQGGLNLYGFAGNTPINEIDPLGLYGEGEGNPVSINIPNVINVAFNSHMFGPPGSFYLEGPGFNSNYQPIDFSALGRGMGADAGAAGNYLAQKLNNFLTDQNMWDALAMESDGLAKSVEPLAAELGGVIAELAAKCLPAADAAEKASATKLDAKSLAKLLEDLGGGVPRSHPTAKGAPQFIFPNGTVLRFDLQPGQYLKGQVPHINLEIPGNVPPNMHIPVKP